MKKGTSVIELLIYGAILAFTSLFAVNTLLAVTDAFSQARTERLVNTNAQNILGRLIREIRFAQTVDGASALDANPSDLILKTFTSATDDAPASIEFSVNNKNLLLKTRAGNVIQLNTSGVTVPIFTVQKITNASASTTAIKFQLAVQASSTKINIQKNFYGTAILRGSY